MYLLLYFEKHFEFIVCVTRTINKLYWHACMCQFYVLFPQVSLSMYVIIQEVEISGLTWVIACIGSQVNLRYVNTKKKKYWNIVSLVKTLSVGIGFWSTLSGVQEAGPKFSSCYYL